MNYFDRKITPSVIEKLKPYKVVILLGSRRTWKTVLVKSIIEKPEAEYNYKSFKKIKHALAMHESLHY
jgi:predicted AAA+ superfamily ATPase